MKIMGTGNMRVLTLEGAADIQVLTVACTEVDPVEKQDARSARLRDELGRIAFRVEIRSPKKRLVLHEPFASVAVNAIRSLSTADLGVRGEHYAYAEIQDRARELASAEVLTEDAEPRETVSPA